MVFNEAESRALMDPASDHEGPAASLLLIGAGIKGAPKTQKLLILRQDNATVVRGEIVAHCQMHGSRSHR